MIRALLPFLGIGVIAASLLVLPDFLSWGPKQVPGPRSPAEFRVRKIDTIEKTYDQVEEEMFDTLQALEPRVPYEPPVRWPTIKEPCQHESLDEIVSNGGFVLTYVCSDCGVVMPGQIEMY